MKRTFGPPRLTVLDLWPGQDFHVFRIVRCDNTDDPVFLNSLRSHYELGEEPRKVERDAAVLHVGISAYLEAGVAKETAKRWSKLGDYVARILLTHGNGFNFAHTGHPLHLTLWGDPVKLCDAVVDISGIED